MTPKDFRIGTRMANAQELDRVKALARASGFVTISEFLRATIREWEVEHGQK